MSSSTFHQKKCCGLALCYWGGGLQSPTLSDLPSNLWQADVMLVLPLVVPHLQRMVTRVRATDWLKAIALAFAYAAAVAAAIVVSLWVGGDLAYLAVPQIAE
jgi:uncharacterized membrane protein YfhO